MAHACQGRKTPNDTPGVVEAFDGLRVTSVALGAAHSAAVTGTRFTACLRHDGAAHDPRRRHAHTEDGRLWVCGNGTSGALGTGSRTSNASFVPVEALAARKVVQVAAGSDFTVCLTSGRPAFRTAPAAR